MRYRIVEQTETSYRDGKEVDFFTTYWIEERSCWLWGWTMEESLQRYNYEDVKKRLNELISRARTKKIVTTKVLKTVKV